MIKWVMLVCFTFSVVSVQADDSAKDFDTRIEKMLEARQGLMKRLFEAFGENEDKFFNDMDKDFESMIKKIRKEGFKNFGGHTFGMNGSNVAIKQVQEEDGTISVFIKPKDKNVKLNIETTQRSIEVKSEMKVEKTEQGQGGSFKSFSSSSFSKTVTIPYGYSAKPPVETKEGVKISLVPDNKKLKRQSNRGRKPIRKRKGESTI